MKIITEHSAGGVVFIKAHGSRLTAHGKLPTAVNDKPSAVNFLICKHSGYHKWALPKGIIEEGETPEGAALREVGEETGIKAKIIRKIIPDITYKYAKNGILVDKTVEFFLMEYVSGDINNHNWEMEEVQCVSANEALKLLAFEEERQVLRSAIQQFVIPSEVEGSFDKLRTGPGEAT